MGRSSYRKFMKQERAKVKLKNKDKKLLPKGQNVTDLNFKVKKIVIKTQLIQHQPDEVLSSRKLNIQEVLSRLNHYSGSVSTEAVGQLESLLKSGGRAFLSTHLCPVVSNLAKLLTSPHSHLRKAAIKLLSQILKEVEEDEWSVLRERLVSYIVCGLSHVELGVRRDSLLALEAIPSTLTLPAESLLPSLLDLVSTSRPAGSRSLSTTLSSSPTALRASVLARIASVLSSLSSSTPDKIEEDEEDTKFSKEDMVRVKLVPSYPLHHDFLSISEFDSFTQLSTSQPLNLKDFTTSLVPLMLDSFAEVAPEPDHSEPVTSLTVESLALVSTIADILVLLFDLLSSEHISQGNWMKDKMGNEVYTRLIEKRFPYSAKSSSSKKGHEGLPRPTPLKVNLTLAFLAQTLVPHSSSSSHVIFHFLADVTRCQRSLRPEEAVLFERCLSASMNLPTKQTEELLTTLVRLQRNKCGVYGEVFSVLRKVVLSGTKPKEMSGWLDNLLTEMAAPQSDLHQGTLKLLIEAAPLVEFPPSFQAHFHSILDKALERQKEEELWSVANLVYWLSSSDTNLLDSLQKLTQLHKHLSPHIIALLSHKCERFPEGDLCRQLQEHSYWKQFVTPALIV